MDELKKENVELANQVVSEMADPKTNTYVGLGVCTLGVGLLVGAGFMLFKHFKKKKVEGDIVEFPVEDDETVIE